MRDLAATGLFRARSVSDGLSCSGAESGWIRDRSPIANDIDDETRPTIAGLGLQAAWPNHALASHSDNGLASNWPTDWPRAHSRPD